MFQKINFLQYELLNLFQFYFFLQATSATGSQNAQISLQVS